jgi:regulatory protein
LTFETNLEASHDAIELAVDKPRTTLMERPGQPDVPRQQAGAPRRAQRAVDAYEDALRMLDRRSRTVSELRQRLARHRHAPSAIEATLQRLVNVGLLDDDAYARQFVRSRLAAGRTAPARVQRELVHRGVDRQTAETALQDVVTEDAVEVETIIDDAVRRRAPSLAKLDAGTRRRRLYAYLARRGFNPDEIRRALERLPD